MRLHGPDCPHPVTDGDRSPYAASPLGSLRHWLNDEDNFLPELIAKYIIDFIVVIVHISGSSSPSKGHCWLEGM